MALIKCSLELLLTDVQINLRAPDGIVAEQFLDDSYVSTIVQKMRRKRVTERIRIHPQTYSESNLLDDCLNGASGKRPLPDWSKQAVVFCQV